MSKTNGAPWCKIKTETVPKVWVCLSAQSQGSAMSPITSTSSLYHRPPSVSPPIGCEDCHPHVAGLEFASLALWNCLTEDRSMRNGRRPYMKVWSDDLAESLKIQLLHSLQIPQKLAEATKSQITLNCLLKELRLHGDQRRFTWKGNRGRFNLRHRAIWSQICVLKGHDRKRWSIDSSSILQRAQMVGSWQFLFLRLSQVRIALLTTSQTNALIFNDTLAF